MSARLFFWKGYDVDWMRVMIVKVVVSGSEANVKDHGNCWITRVMPFPIPSTTLFRASVTFFATFKT